VHIVLTVKVLGQEYWSNETVYGCTKLKTVQLVQKAVTEALLGLNKVKDLKKLEER